MSPLLTNVLLACAVAGIWILSEVAYRAGRRHRLRREAQECYPRLLRQRAEFSALYDRAIACDMPEFHRVKILMTMAEIDDELRQMRGLL
jgi:hypothetical protein